MQGILTHYSLTYFLILFMTLGFVLGHLQILRTPRFIYFVERQPTGLDFNRRLINWLAPSSCVQIAYFLLIKYDSKWTFLQLWFLPSMLCYWIVCQQIPRAFFMFFKYFIQWPIRLSHIFISRCALSFEFWVALDPFIGIVLNEN